ncbi:MAG: hypothetical protein JO232_14705 [Verrucomicrobia bacterium]|nr:hypothetical protein [Verrucomicrobiota bacterium]
MKLPHFVLKLLPILGCALMLSSSGALAALPPWVYDELKSKAPEKLTIKVLSADVTDSLIVTASGTRGCLKLEVKQVCAQAEVITVDRSATGLKPGSIIQIIYTTAPTPENVGTAVRPEILDEGMIRRAYLKQRGAGVMPDNSAFTFDETYDVAAWGQSFEKLD